MSPELDPKDLERLLRSLPVTPAPAALWDRIQLALQAAEAPAPAGLRRKASPWLAAAAAVVAMLAGGVGGLLMSYRAPRHWSVQALAGTPLLGGVALTRAGSLRSVCRW